MSAIIEAKVVSRGELFLGSNDVLDMIQSLLGHSMRLRQYLRVYRKLLEAVEDEGPQQHEGGVLVQPAATCPRQVLDTAVAHSSEAISFIDRFTT